MESPIPERNETMIGSKDLEHMLALRDRFDNDLGGHAVAGGDGNILWCDAEFARIAGFQNMDGPIGANLRQLEASPGPLGAMLERLEGTQLIPPEELHFVRHDGAAVHALGGLAATLDPDGHVSEVRVSLRDIADHGRDDVRLREEAERYRLARLASGDVVWDWDLASGRITFDECAAERFGHVPSEGGTSFLRHLEHIHHEDRHRVLRGLERAILGGEDSWRDEYRYRRADGAYVSILDRARIVRTPRGEPARLVGCMVDVSELKASEEAQRFLAEAARLLGEPLEPESLARSLASLAVPTLADFCLVDLLEPGGGLRRMAAAHVTREEASLGAGSVAAVDSDVDRFALWSVIRCGEAAYAECEGDDLGSRLGLSSAVRARAYLVAPIVVAGRVAGTATFGLVNPARCWSAPHLETLREAARRAGSALDRALIYGEARQAADSRDELLRMVSHDLRDPLQTIVQTIGLMADRVPPRRLEIHRWLKVLRHASDQMRVLLEALLDSARLDSGHFAIDRVRTNPARTIADACDMLSPLAEANEVAIELSMAQHLPSLAMDAPQITRVVANLLGNAIKFSPPGGVIHVAVEARDADLVVSVRDHGAGIATADQVRVFDRFWRGKPGDRRGVGLGLAISRAIVEAHGGRIWLDSRVGEGSTFSFAIPIDPPPPTAECDDPSPGSTRGLPARPITPPSGGGWSDSRKRR